jgi:hypothetical protein
MRPNRAAPKSKETTVTSNKITARRTRTLAAVMLMTAGAGVTSLIGATAPATAAPDAYIALAVGDLNDAPPVRTAGGSAIGGDQNQLSGAALSNCVDNGGQHCVLEIITSNGCAAAAANDYGEVETAANASVQAAENSAKGKLQNQQGARIVVSGCSNGQTPPPPPPPAPAPPKLGPTASFNPTLGGLEAHITDRSGVASQCTYAMENVNRSFGLAANATFELRIVPLLPKFRAQSVTITCDNGTKTQTSTHF